MASDEEMIIKLLVKMLGRSLDSREDFLQAEADARDVPRERKRPKRKRKASAYSKRYGAAFRKLSPKYKLKNGSWGKDGFKRCQKAAHKLARKD